MASDTESATYQRLGGRRRLTVVDAVLGAVLAFVFPGRAPATTRFSELAEPERGPVKL